LTSSGQLHRPHGAPAAPQPQALGPSQARRMWVSHTQRVPSQRVHLIVTRASRLLRLGGPTQHCRVGAAPSLALHRAFRCGACQKPCNTHADWRPYSRRPSTDIASLIHSSAVRSHASLSSGLTALAAALGIPALAESVGIVIGHGEGGGLTSVILREC
jgi:hypothetical protein